MAESTNPDAAHLIPFAQYNVGRAYYEGFGVKQSDKQAERWFLTAAQDGEPSGSIKAQTVLGMFYSRADEESFDLQKVGFSFFCTNDTVAANFISLKCMYFDVKCEWAIPENIHRQRRMASIF